MRILSAAALLACAAIVTAAACSRGTSGLASSEPLIRSVESMHGGVRQFMLKAADDIPDEDLTYKPTADVRSVGQILLHVAYWQYFFCGEAKGEKPERPALLTAFNAQHENLEAIGATKATVVEALRASYDYCDTAFKTLTPEDAGKIIAAPGFMHIDQAPRIHFLSYNVSHANQHYGNLVTYMRLKGRVPPSSQPR
jgi:uncharacterized damage-inducible protein DinB